MHDRPIHILSTRPLSPASISHAAEQGMSVDVVPFIDVQPLPLEHIKTLVEPVMSEKATVVFTSMNAVEAISGMIVSRPAWKIYCIGRQTRKLVEDAFGKDAIAGTAESAGSLADKMLEDGVSGLVYFFCGDRRRDELPGKLRAHGIRLDERVVYETHTLAALIERTYDGILFFSPSAVEAFFNSNKADERTVLFAIGQTTAAEIKKYCNNLIYTSDLAGKERLLEEAIAFFRPGSASRESGLQIQP